MIYFISDAHLGNLYLNDSKSQEKKLVGLLDKMKKDATAIYLLGDMFDFWFEYKTVVPKGFVRFLGKLAEITDAGIEVHFFTGNHDIWTFGYLENEVGLIVHREPQTLKIGNKVFYLAHGDGLYSFDKKFNFVRKIFHNPLAQKMFRLLPPQIGQGFGYWWSKNNRIKKKYEGFRGEDKEYLVVYSKQYAKDHPEVDFMIYGHRHIALDLQIVNNKRVIILGDFIMNFSYGVFDGENFWLEYME